MCSANWEKMLDELLDDESDTMSAWEIEFIESLSRQRQSPRFEPSPKQLKRLDEVWHKVFG